MPLRTSLKTLVAFSLTALVAISAQAQIEEVIVTAQKRAESIQDVPISMQALGGSDIEKFEIKRADDITRFMANVQAAAPVSDTHMNYYIRGIGESNFHANSVGAVGLYLDQVALHSPLSSAFSLFDIKRVEVLRGPQNTLFGKNTTGGAIQYHTNKPEIGGETNGYLDLTYGRWNQWDVEAGWGTAITDTLAFRVAGTTHNRDGIIENLITGQDLWDTERHSGRAQLLWAPTDDVEVLFNVHGGVNRGGNISYNNWGTQDPANPQLPCAVPVADFEPGIPCADGGGVVHTGNWDESQTSLQNLRNDLDNWGANITLKWDLGWAEMTSITAYESNAMVRNEDSSDAPSVLFAFLQESELDQWSQEIRFASQGDDNYRWILGGFYFFEEQLLTTVVRRAPPGVSPLPPGVTYPPGSFTILPSVVFFQDDEEWSIYGQGEYDFNDQLTITLGIRGSWETKEGWNLAQVGNGGQFAPDQFIGKDEVLFNPLFVVGRDPLHQKSEEWGGKAGVDYRFNDDFLVYFNALRGFKSGGFSVAALQAILGEAATDVLPETLVTYEGGFKSEWFDGTVQFNAAVFMNEWTNQQIFSLILRGGIVLPLLINVPETSNWGADMDATWVPGDGWHLQLGLGFINSEVDDATDLPTVTVGNELPYNPEFSLAGLVRKEWDMAGGVVALQTDFQYHASQTYDIENKPESSEDSFFEIGVRGSYTFGPNDRYTVAAWGKNLTGTDYCTNIGDLRGGLSETQTCTPYIGDPTYGVSARLNWN